MDNGGGGAVPLPLLIIDTFVELWYRLSSFVLWKVECTQRQKYFYFILPCFSVSN